MGNYFKYCFPFLVWRPIIEEIKKVCKLQPTRIIIFYELSLAFLVNICKMISGIYNKSSLSGTNSLLRTQSNVI